MRRVLVCLGALVRAGGKSFPLSKQPTRLTTLTFGLTIWRARKPSEKELLDPNAKKEKLGVDDELVYMVVERLPENAELKDGDLIQIGVEYLPASLNKLSTGKAMFLNVMNEEEFDDGTVANRKLIFPTRRTHAGDIEYFPDA